MHLYAYYSTTSNYPWQVFNKTFQLYLYISLTVKLLNQGEVTTAINSIF